jgi:hypothetical protein
MAYAQHVTRAERRARTRRIPALPAGLDGLVAYLVFATSVGFAAACVLGLIP